MLFMLVFYINLASTSLSEDAAIQNLTIHLKKFLAGIDPALIFGETQSDVIGARSRRTVTSILDHSIAPQRVRRQAKFTKKTKGTTTKMESAQVKNKRLKSKIYDMMQQFLYSAQERLWPISPVLERYQSQSPFRMAFIFGQLELLTHEANSIMSYVEKRRQPAMQNLTVTQLLQIYWSLMLKNVDVTYLVEYIREHAPQDQVSQLSLRVLRKEKENIEKQMLGRTRARRRYRN